MSFNEIIKTLKKSRKKGKKGRKIGRNKSKCDSYKVRGVRLTNKKKKLVRHIKEHPSDSNAEISLGCL